MLLVLNNVNDNMHQIGITGFHVSFNLFILISNLNMCKQILNLYLGRLE